MDEVTGIVRFSIRSWAAQFGLVGFSREYSEVGLHGNTLKVATLVSDLSGNAENPLLSSLQELAHKRIALIVRGLILPHVADNGLRVLPVRQDVHYNFRDKDVPSEVLQEVWCGKQSGRKVIEAYRQNLGSLPESLPPKGYLVGSVYADVGDNYWVLEPEVLRRNVDGFERVQALHEESCGYDPRRTAGDRQVEIAGINGSDESLVGLHVQAKVYKTDLEKLHCIHLEGV